MPRMTIAEAKSIALPLAHQVLYDRNPDAARQLLEGETTFIEVLRYAVVPSSRLSADEHDLVVTACGYAPYIIRLNEVRAVIQPLAEQLLALLAQPGQYDLGAVVPLRIQILEKILAVVEQHKDPNWQEADANWLLEPTGLPVTLEEDLLKELSQLFGQLCTRADTSQDEEAFREARWYHLECSTPKDPRWNELVYRYLPAPRVADLEDGSPYGHDRPGLVYRVAMVFEQTQEAVATPGAPVSIDHAIESMMLLAYREETDAGKEAISLEQEALLAAIVAAARNRR